MPASKERMEGRTASVFFKVHLTTCQRVTLSTHACRILLQASTWIPRRDAKRGK
jgi:hypothetical protein